MNAKSNVTLILGGARSGKSSYAQSLAEAAETSVTFIATAQALDEEMSARIQSIAPNAPSVGKRLKFNLTLHRSCTG